MSGLGTIHPNSFSHGLNLRLSSNPTPMSRATTAHPGDVPLTVEELLAKCESTMRSLDDQLRSKLADQQHRNDNLSGLGQASQAISGYPQPLGDKATDQERSEHAAAVKKCDDALNLVVSQHPDLAKTVADAKAALQNGNGSTDGKKNAGDIVSQEMDAYRNENETSMIEIQSIVSKRSQALQMTSNMVNSMNESAKSLIQNIR